MNYDLTTDILQSADDFYEAYKRCREVTNERHQGSKTINIPAIVNGAFACELYTKYLANSKLTGHNLKLLFAELDEKYQKLANDITLWNGLNKLKKILPLGAPVRDVHVTSKYGTRTDPFTGTPKHHKGIDFAGKIGTELMAVAPGRVVSAGERVGYGTTVEIDHGLGFTTLYAHLSKINVSRGDWVRPGTVVGLGGSSGRSTGPHLHYEIRYKGTPFDPEKFVKE